MKEKTGQLGEEDFGGKKVEQEKWRTMTYIS